MYPKQTFGRGNITFWEKDRIFWEKEIKKRQVELQKLNNSGSFIPFASLGKKNKIYDVHDNGGRPFRVIANVNGIFVYKNTSVGYDQPEIYSDLVLQIKDFLGYWFGFDTTPHKFHGNSILIQLRTDKYVYVGNEIYAFMTDEKIIDYLSPVGNSDVPYPVAYGKKFVYFMLDKEKIKINDLETEVNVANAEDLYGEFYKKMGFFESNFNDIVLIHDRLH